MFRLEEIRQVHLEPTQRCQAACPMCNRTQKDGKVNRHLNNADLSLDDIKRLMPPEFVRQLDNLYMCGNHGDPIFAPDCMDIFKYLRKENPNIHLSMITNGGARDPEWWEELAGIVDKVEFSIDGLDDTNHIYRVGVNWNRLEENLDAFTSAGGNAKWTFLVFDYNEHQVEAAERFANLFGIKEFVVKKSARFVSTRRKKRKDNAKARDRHGNVTQIIKEPTMDKYKNNETKKFEEHLEAGACAIDCKAIQKKEIYISAEGLIHPCCWTANAMYKWWENIGDDPVWKFIGDEDLTSSVRNVVEGPFFKRIANSWEDNPLQVCTLKCNKEFDPFKAQWT